jgi:hypothetical protein
VAAEAYQRMAAVGTADEEAQAAFLWQWVADDAVKVAFRGGLAA